MWAIFKVKPASAILPLLIFSAFSPALCTAQSAKISLDTYVSQSVADAGTLYGVAISEWLSHHPGEMIQALQDSGSGFDPNKAFELSPRQQNDRSLEGRWCLRSVTEMDLPGGIQVRRTALFYQPLVESAYGQPLPTLPAETGEALRNHACKLARILHEFDGASDSQALLETVARQLPGGNRMNPENSCSPREAPTGNRFIRSTNSATHLPFTTCFCTIQRPRKRVVRPPFCWNGNGELRITASLQ